MFFAHAHTYTMQAVGQAQAAVKRCLEVLDSALATQTFLVGERVTLADITLVCNLLLLYKQVTKNLPPPRLQRVGDCSYIELFA